MANFRITQEERDMVNVLVACEGEAFSVLVRQWIRRRYAELTKAA